MAEKRLNVCVVGVGLIGGSLGLALRKRHRKNYTLVGLGRNTNKLRRAVKLGAIDRYSANAAEAVRDADLVVLCVPVHHINAQLKRLVPHLKCGAVVTDVGSVKAQVIADAKRALSSRKDVSFVGAHPIAGSEKTGVDHARADLFENAVCVVATDGAPFHALEIIDRLWRDAGAKRVAMKAADHDRWLALTSHLPHLLAFALFANVWDATKKNPIVKSLVAGSFRDMTRIAAADPEMWAGILQSNRAEIGRAVNAAVRELKLLTRARLPILRKNLTNLQKAKTDWAKFQ